MTSKMFETVLRKIKSSLNKNAEQNALNTAAVGFQRKNLLMNTHSIDSTAVHHGYSFKRLPDGSIEISGKTADAQNGDYYFFGTFYGSDVVIDDPRNDFIISGEGCTSQVFIRVRGIKNEDVGVVTLAEVYSGNDVRFSGKITSILITADKRETITDPIIIKPMLRYADIEDATYEPYTPSLQDQINTVEGSLDQISGILAKAMVSGKNLNGNEGTDLNNVTTMGVYKYHNGPLNNPSNSQGAYGVLLVLNPNNERATGSNTYVVQVAFNRFVDSLAANVGVYFRATANGGLSWTDWRKFTIE